MKSININLVVTIFYAVLALNSSFLQAQNLERKASFDGIPANNFFAFDPSFSGGLHFDFNRDGIQDLPFLDVKDGTSNTLSIINGANPNAKWNIPLGYENLALNYERTRLMGFCEMDGDPGTTEIILADKIGNRFNAPVILSARNRGDVDLGDVVVTRILNSPEYFAIGSNDMNGDGKIKIIVANKVKQTTEIWGF